MNKWVWLLLVLLAIGIAGCRSRLAGTGESTDPPRRDLPPARLLAELLARDAGDTSAQMKAAATLFVDGQALRSRVQMRWLRDRALQVSILPLMGVEICRLVLTPDTIHLIDRYHKQYAAASVGEWPEVAAVGLTFEAVQSLFPRPDLSCRDRASVPTMPRFSRPEPNSSGGYLYHTGVTDQAPGHIVWTVDGRVCLTSILWQKPQPPVSWLCRYDGYRVVKGRTAPGEMTFALSGAGRFPLSFSFEKMEYDWNTPQHISAVVPASYKRTDLKTWIETITQ